jgi:hypothetical protein
MASAPAEGRRLQPGELGFPLVLGAALAVWTALPYVLGHALDSPHSRFADSLAYGRDFNSYASYVRQSAEGHWLFVNQFTPEPHLPVFFNLEFLLTGKVARLLGLSAGLALQVQRTLAALACAPVFYWVSSFLLRRVAMRRLVLVLALTWGGFGWMADVPGLRGILERLPPGDPFGALHPFFSLLLQPHFLVAEVLTLLALGLYLRGEVEDRTRDVVLAGAVSAALGTVRPFDMVFLCATTVAFYLAWGLLHRDLTSRGALRRLLPAALSVPVLLYDGWLFTFHPVFRWWGKVGMAPHLPPRTVLSGLLERGGLLVGLGLVLVPLVAAIPRLRPLRSCPRPLFGAACATLASLALLCSFPIFGSAFQFLTTLGFPLVLLATAPHEDWVTAALAQRRWPAAAIAGFLALNAVDSARLYAQAFRSAVSGRHRVAGSLLEACRWLQDHSEEGQLALASPGNSNRLARYTHLRVVAGYDLSTVRYAEKEEAVGRFYEAGTPERVRRGLLLEYDARFVLHSGEERDLGGFNPAAVPYLRPVFRERGVSVYEVMDPRAHRSRDAGR